MRRRRKRKDRKIIQLVTHTHPKLPISEQYRLIRTNIQFSSVDEEIKTIMITSPEPGDGKSTTSANLAVVLAQQGKRVILVDADLRKPSVHYAFNISNIEGLTSVLTKKNNLDEVIRKTYIPNLRVLSSGPIPPNPSELLVSKSMETVIEELEQMFDYVVFDTPPVLVAADSQILANKCDGVVMVIASEKTSRDRALQAKELLEKVKSRILGVVVNGVETKKSEYYYSYK